MQNHEKIILITGCSSGFGQALVEKFLKKGWTTVATLRQAEQRQELFSEMTKAFPGQLYVKNLDVTSDQDRERLAGFVADKFGGKLNCLINNAGYGLFGALEDVTEAQIKEQMDCNFFGTVLMTRTFLPFLRAAQGRIINISSAFGFTGFPLTSIYCASKFAIEGFTESMNYELRPHGVTACVVAPGGYGTKFGTNVVWPQGNYKESVYSTQTNAYHNLMSKIRSRNKSNPADVENAILKIAEAKAPYFRTRVGKDAKSIYLAQKMLPARLLHKIKSIALRKVFS